MMFNLQSMADFRCLGCIEYKLIILFILIEKVGFF